MLLKQVILSFLGFTSGGIIAAGIFAFLAAIGIFPRIIAKTRTRRHIRLYESMIILGGITGNLLNLYHLPIRIGGNLLLILIGSSIGIFVGCLVMSLAETLQAFPVMVRRIHMAVGLQWMIACFAIGKMTGALWYFVNGWGN